MLCAVIAAGDVCQVMNACVGVQGIELMAKAKRENDLAAERIFKGV